MLKVFEGMHKNVHFRIKKTQIDNPVFKLHYVFTFAILIACTILVCCRQYIGEHIRCIADKGVSASVIETFCFFTTTFTVVRHLNGTDLNSGAMAAHPGVGPMIEGEPIIRHAYYQWVPFMLFGQALCFYLPHIIWKKMEGGRVNRLVSGLDFAAIAFSDVPTKLDKGTVPSKSERMEKIEKIKRAYVDHLQINGYWINGLILGEVLNLLNLVIQIWMMNWFLGGQFLSIGRLIFGDDPDDDMYPMDIIFPKVTKCTFYKYGPTGTIQQHDALCVMALNVINEKIYVFLWFWFLILLIISVMALIYRLISLVLYKKSEAFNRFIYRYCCPVLLDPISVRTIQQSCSASALVFLHYIALSMDGFVFHDFFNMIAKEFESKKKIDKKGRKDSDKQPLITKSQEQGSLEKKPLDQWPLEQQPLLQQPLEQRLEQQLVQQQPIEQQPLEQPQQPLQQQPIEQQQLEQQP